MSEGKPGTFASRLDALFRASNCTYKEVITGTGEAIQHVYLWKLRTGQAQNPSYRVILVLSRYFHVDPGYFFELPERENQAKTMDAILAGLRTDLETWSSTIE